MKKFLLLLTLILSLTTVSFAAEINLTDIKDTKYENAVNELVNLNVIAGYPNGEFRPLNKITRAEIAKILVTAKGIKINEEAEKNKYFEDVIEEHWALAYINAAYKNELVEGYEDKTFKPDSEVTYAEAITMVVRLLGYKSNVEMQGGTWPENYIKKATKLDILDNVEYDDYNDEAIRGEIAVLIWDALRVEKKYTTAGVLEKVTKNQVGDYIVTISEESYQFTEKDNSSIISNINEYIDGVVFYSLVKSFDKNDVKFLAGLTVATIKDDSTYTYYVEDKEDDELLFTKGTDEVIVEFDEDFYDEYDGYIFIGLKYDKDQSEVIDITLVNIAENVTAKDFKKFDRVYKDTTNEIVYIVTGVGEIK